VNFAWGSIGRRACPGWAPPPANCAGRGGNFGRGSTGCLAFRGEPPPPGPLPPLRRGGGDLNRASAGLMRSTARAVREGGLWAVVAATSVAPGRRRSARVPGEGPTAAEASVTVTAAAPGLVRVLGWILRPASGVLRASAARLGLRMTGCGARKTWKRARLAPFHRGSLRGKAWGWGAPRPSTWLGFDAPASEVVPPRRC
jgi:hypothetical protein